MRAILCLAGLALVTASGSVRAADLAPYMPTKAAVAAPVLYSWTGFYMGVNAGWAFQNGGEDIVAVANGAAINFGSEANGFIGGGQLGYRQQFGAFVFGIEGDFDWADIHGTTGVAAAGLAVPNTSNMQWLGSTRLNLGLLLTPQTLGYITGGLEYGATSFNLAMPGVAGLNYSGTRIGWTAGLGVEHKFTQNWSAGAEVRYFDLGTPTVTNLANTVTLSNKFDGVLGVLKLNYSF